MISAIIASTIVLGLAGLAASLARRASASVRHAIWLVGLVTALGAGALAAIGPVLEVESTLVDGPGVASLPADFGQSIRDVSPALSAIAADLPMRIPDDVAPRFRVRPDAVLFALWAFGVAVIIGRTVVAHLAVARLVGRSRHLDVDRRLEVDGSIDVRVSADVDGPFTLGARHPVILLPPEAELWNRDRLQIVLVHEAAHVARLDYVAQLVATAACAVYWFNPIAWLAASRLRAEAEHAADDRVLAAGVDGVTYASHLLELARPERAPMSAAMAVGMARGTSRLERRFTAMLDSQRSRGIVPLRMQAAIGSAALLAVVPLTSVRFVPATKPGLAVVSASPAPIVSPAPRPTLPVIRTVKSPVTSAIAMAKGATAESDTIIEHTLAAAAGERVFLDLKVGGSVTVHAWNQSQVRMRAVLSGDQARSTRVTFERAGGGLEIRAFMDYYPNNSRNSNSFELWVPKKFDVEVRSAGGSISIDGVEGLFSGNTGGGEITLDNVSGRARLNTGGGEVRVTNSSLEGSVNTGGGEAIVTNTTGGVQVSSGSGPVIRTTGGETRVFGVGGLASSTSITSDGKPMIVVDGNVVSGGGISYNKAGGDIRLESIPYGGTFNTGGGSIVVGSVGSTASFTTGGGDVRISNVADDISVTTGAGSVEIAVVEGNGTARNVSVSSGSGRIVIDLPRNIDARFELETAYTERHGRTNIESDFPLSVTEGERWESREGTPRKYVRATGTAGSGRGLIRIRTVNGDVVIRRR